jgi:uncharacterized protein (DUF433 family)
MSGEPCVTGTRIRAWAIWDFYCGGASIVKIIEEYPTLTREQVIAALEYCHVSLPAKPDIPEEDVDAAAFAYCRDQPLDNGGVPEDVEAAALAIYEQYEFGVGAPGEKPTWVYHGNSIMQGRARWLARAALKALADRGWTPPRGG